VLLSPGKELRVPLAEFAGIHDEPENSTASAAWELSYRYTSIATLEEAERSTFACAATDGVADCKA